MASSAPNSNIQPGIATGNTYIGVFLVSLATLMYEIHLTRIFSVTMWYHFAFMAISIAMFGLTAGALVVYLRKDSSERTLALSALAFAVTIVISFVIHLAVPFQIGSSAESILSIAITFSSIAVPFTFSGICICIALTRFPSQTSKMYAADLGGAAGGCIALVALLRYVDGATAVIVIAVLASLSAWYFGRDCQSVKLRQATVITGLGLAGLAVLQAVLFSVNEPLFRFSHVKLGQEPGGYEKWNSFSRVCIWGNPYKLHRPMAWGLSPTYPTDRRVSQLIMSIDAGAWSPLNLYDGTPANVEHLKYDVTNIAHYLRPDSRVLVIGVGGGRDIVSALLFNQKSVLGVEMNENILYALNRVFGAYTGHLDKDPRVTFVNDEARSYVMRSKEQFDIIQISLVDTWAATSSGAYCLTENSLYTLESFKSMLQHLTPRGVLAVSRWYYGRRPAEMYRLTSLAREALKQIGVTDTRSHMIIVGNIQPHRDQLWPDGIGTLLVSREPFTSADLDLLKAITKKMRFDIALTPTDAVDPMFGKLASASEADSVITTYPFNLAAPTDDSPYFFSMLRLKNMFDRRLWEQGLLSFNTQAVVVLGSSLMVTTLLTLLTIVVPLSFITGWKTLKSRGALLTYFGSIGLGFMFIEVSQMQRLSVFLGHPVYGLSVLLFTLLLSSSLGSLVNARMAASGATGRLLALLALLAIFGLASPAIVASTQMTPTSTRILTATAMLFPLGFGMGMAFPIGMSLANTKSPALMPWFWAINGATSVCGSVAAVATAITFGITAVFWTGAACYLVAAASYALALRSAKPEDTADAVPSAAQA